VHESVLDGAEVPFAPPAFISSIAASIKSPTEAVLFFALSAERAKNRTASVGDLIDAAIDEIKAGGAKGTSAPSKTDSCTLTAAGIQVFPTNSNTGASVCYKVDAATAVATVKAF